MRSMRKNFLKSGYVGLFIALLMFFGGVEARVANISPALTQALEQAQAEVPGSPGYKPVSGTVVEADKYVQTEAHLQVDAVKEQMAKIEMYLSGGVKDQRTSNELVTPYMNIIAAAIDRALQGKPYLA